MFPAGLLVENASIATEQSGGVAVVGGDSGGPVFSGTVAFGITKGISSSDDRCGFYFFMSTDYLPPSWSLLLPAAPAMEAALATMPDNGAGTLAGRTP